VGRKAVAGLSSGWERILGGDGGYSRQGDAGRQEEGQTALVPADLAAIVADRGLQLSGEEMVFCREDEDIGRGTGG
jgi:hypothetical protein